MVGVDFRPKCPLCEHHADNLVAHFHVVHGGLHIVEAKIGRILQTEEIISQKVLRRMKGNGK